MRAKYYDPATDEVVDAGDCAADGVASLLGVILGLSCTQRGYPALELQREDGSSLSLSTDGARVYLVYMNSLGESFHSIGGMGVEDLVFDYFGSWSEAPASYLVSVDDALECARAFALSGTADTARVLFEPD